MSEVSLYTGGTLQRRNETSFRTSRHAAFSGDKFISKHLQFMNLVQGNLLHRTIFISNIKVNV